MSQIETGIDLAHRALVLALELGLPLLGVAFAVGLLFSILGTVTQIDEPTLASIPKLFAVGGIALVLAPWYLSVLAQFAKDVLESIHSTGAR
ncbi:MAG TPA: flagellar biosynthetic protein FliQ [Planctomycetota bacterium]|nr:flagellar biosynthetic protein FliQ [Planctomycetota bacterium]